MKGGCDSGELFAGCKNHFYCLLEGILRQAVRFYRQMGCYRFQIILVLPSSLITILCIMIMATAFLRS